MKVVGFTFIKNAVRYQYPVAEAIRSILPLCDEVVVAVGRSDDGTRALIEGLGPRVRIVDTDWDESLRAGGRVLAAETNKAFAAIGADADWCFYIQGDEVLHEDGVEKVRAALLRYKDNPEVDGLLFRYKHFYGSYDYVGTSSRWYRREIRVVRNNRSIYSYRDAQSFRKGDNGKLQVKPVDAYIYHYGWVREPKAMQDKMNEFHLLYHGHSEADPEHKLYTGPFDYSGVDALARFNGKHPAVMQEWIGRMNWKFEHDLSFNRIKMKDRFKNAIEWLTGRRPFDFQNYKII
ncbi:MAG: glycosyltransferase family 2 protein [Chitinophagaceae bacterium]|nr:MAG: glycosyltransferase family 2 protein [Chitinophagaceae bacterium]